MPCFVDEVVRCVAVFVATGVVGFQPKKKGSYSVEVTQEGKPIAGSPFRIEVGDAQLCQASKVHVSGANKEAKANKWNEVHINIKDAGRGKETKGKTIYIAPLYYE